MSLKSFIGVKCLDYQYARDMYDKGLIAFSSACNWSNIKEKGQGDINEGIFRIIENIDTDTLHKLELLYGKNLNIRKDKIYSYLRLNSVALLPAYCFYVLSENQINYKPYEGIQKCNVNISKRIFKDFAGNRSENVMSKLMNLPEDDTKPAIVGINDLDMFYYSIKKALHKFGVKDDEILIYKIKYKSFSNDPYVTYQYPPDELFIKDSYYEYQQEVRIVINSPKFILEKGEIRLIEIGDMSHYSHLKMGYYPEGLNFEMDAIIEKKKDIIIDEYCEDMGNVHKRLSMRSII